MTPPSHSSSIWAPPASRDSSRPRRGASSLSPTGRTMKIFLAGAGGAIGRRLTPLLRGGGHTVVGPTRPADKADALLALGAQPLVVDGFDSDALRRAVKAAGP